MSVQIDVFERAVMVRGITEKRFFPFSQRPDFPDGRAHVEKPGFKRPARRNQAAGAEDHVVFDDGSVHDDGSDADQAVFADAAAMQHRPVADGDILAYA